MIPEHLRQQLEAAQTKEYSFSILDAFAHSFIESGKEGIRGYMLSKADRERGILYIDQGFLEGLFSQHSQHLGMIELGFDVVVLRDAIVERRFSRAEYVHRWNSGMTGFPMLQISDTSSDEVDIPSELEWREMIALSSGDPSLGAFFEGEGRNKLPKGLRKIVNQPIASRAINAVLPQYKEAMRELAPYFYIPDRVELLNRHIRLKKYDSVIGKVQADIDEKMERKFGWVGDREDLNVERSELLGRLTVLDRNLSM